jgi:peptide/nickel transport system substrate-binding protein
MSILPDHQLSQVEDSSKVEGHAQWQNSGNVGTGPFKLVETEPFQFLVLEAYEDYHFGKPKIDKIQLVNQHKKTALAAQKNEMDYGPFISTEESLELKDMDHMEVAVRPSNHFTSITMNVTKAPLSDVRVRQALLYALDREAMAEAVFAGFEDVISPPPNAPLPALGWTNTKLTKYEHNPDKAKALLKEAGVASGTEITLNLRDIDMGGIRQDLATLAQAYLKDVGIELKVEAVEATTLAERMLKGDFQMYLGGWAAMNPFVLSNFRSESNQGSWGYGNPKVDALLEQLASATAMEEIRRLSDEVQAVVWEDVATIPLLQSLNFSARSKRLKTVGPITDNYNAPVGTPWHLWEIVE